MITLERQIKCIEDLRVEKDKSMTNKSPEGDLEMLANADMRNQLINHAVRHVQFRATKAQIQPLRQDEEL